VLLATSTCLSAAVNAFLLWRGLRRSGVYTPRAGWGALIGRVLVANAVMAGLLLALSQDLARWLSAPPLYRAFYLLALIAAGAAAYAAVLWLGGLRPAHLRNAAGGPPEGSGGGA
jgi:putative peptidoglycan lipid II flippase